MGDDFSLVKSRGLRRRLDLHKLAEEQGIDDETEETGGIEEAGVLDDLEEVQGTVEEAEPVTEQAEEEEAEQSDLEFCRAEKERITTEIGEESARRVKIFVVAGLAALFAIFMIISMVSGLKKDKEAIAALPYTRFSQGEITASETTYTDTMKISKYAELENGSLLLFFEGTPDNFAQSVRIPVTSSVYNMVDNGDIAKITYQIVSVSSDTGTIDKAVNLKIKSVQEGI